MKHKSLIFAAATAAALMAAPAAFAQASGTDLLERCKGELNFRGTLKVVGGRAVETTFINATQARAINDCAAGYAKSRRVDSYPLYVSSPSCYRNAPILYRGTSYCYRGR